MLITAGRVLTGSGTYLEDGAVLVEGDSIVAVGPRAQLTDRVGADGRHLAFPDATVVPGLIDAHVHLAFDGGNDPVATLDESSDETLLEDMRRRAEQLLRSGVTTVRDLGDRHGWRSAWTRRSAGAALPARASCPPAHRPPLREATATSWAVRSPAWSRSVTSYDATSRRAPVLSRPW